MKKILDNIFLFLIFGNFIFIGETFAKTNRVSIRDNGLQRLNRVTTQFTADLIDEKYERPIMLIKSVIGSFSITNFLISFVEWTPNNSTPLLIS